MRQYFCWLLGHDWKFEEFAFIHAFVALSHDCDNIPLQCRCGKKALADWRNGKLVNIKEHPPREAGEVKGE